MEPNFGELRSILQGPVDMETWKQLLDLIRLGWETDEALCEDAWAPYIEAHITRWYEAFGIEEEWDEREWWGYWKDPFTLSADPLLEKDGTWLPWQRYYRSLSFENTSLAFNDLDKTYTLIRHVRPKHLDFRLTTMNKPSFLELLSRSAFEGVTHLDLSDAELDPECGLAFSNNETTRQIVYLDIESANLGDEGIKNLMEGPYLDNVAYLNLSWIEFNEDGAKAIAQAEKSNKLTHLDIGGTNIGYPGVVPILESNNLSSLQALIMYHCDFTPAVVDLLSLASFTPQLTKLCLYESSLGPEGAQKLATSECFSNLEMLDVGSSGLEEADIYALVHSKTLRNLKVLDVRENEASDDFLMEMENQFDGALYYMSD